MLNNSNTLLTHILGGSISVLGIYLTMVLLDIFSGYLKALKSHSWMSSLNLDGLLTKFMAFVTIIAAAALDKMAPYLGVQLPINVALIWTLLLCVYEFGSILENASEMGVKINWLMKWLNVFEDSAPVPKSGHDQHKEE